MNGLPLLSDSFSVPLAPVTLPGVQSAVAWPLREMILGPENALINLVRQTIIAERVRYNPVVICGSHGSGKTSLLHAFVALKSQQLGDRQIVSTSGAEFARAFRQAVDTGAASDLRSEYCRCDLFALDGLDELVEYEPAQHEFAKLLDSLASRGRLVLITAIKLADGNSLLSSELRSRLFSGLAVTVHPPAAATRRKILQLLVAAHDLEMPHELLDELVVLTDRPLGTQVPMLNRLVLQLKLACELEQRPIDQELVMATTSQLHMQGYSFANVTTTVAKYYRLRTSDLTGPSRRKQIALARSLAMYLARLLTGESLSKIGQYFGDRDHTTVLHSVRKVAKLAQEHSPTRFAIKEIRDRLPNILEDRKSPRSR